MPSEQRDVLHRWKLILGSEADKDKGVALSKKEKAIDKALGGLYGIQRKGGLKKSYPRVSDWLDDIRTYFPREVVSIIQMDAIERLGLVELLAEAEVAEVIEPNIELVSTLLALKNSLPEEVKETARLVIKKIVDRIKEQLKPKLEKAHMGYMSSKSHRRKSLSADLDWRKTIYRNLKHYDPETGKLMPEKIFSFQRNRYRKNRIVVLVDSSASMSTSIVYASIYACVLSSLPGFETRLVLFDSEIADVSSHLDDPTELLFGKELGGGTHIGKALEYAKTIIDDPQNTHLFLISDLEEGYAPARVPVLMNEHKMRGTRCICITALTDEGNPAYDKDMASKLSTLEIPVFGCTPDLFPQLLIDAVEGKSLTSVYGQYAG